MTTHINFRLQTKSQHISQWPHTSRLRLHSNTLSVIQWSHQKVLITVNYHTKFQVKNKKTVPQTATTPNYLVITFNSLIMTLITLAINNKRPYTKQNDYEQTTMFKNKKTVPQTVTTPNYLVMIFNSQIVCRRFQTLFARPIKIQNAFWEPIIKFRILLSFDWLWQILILFET